MKIAIPREIAEGEARVAAVPDTVKKYVALGFEVSVEKNAGMKSGYADEEYKNAGAKIVAKADALYKDADVVLKIKAPEAEELSLIKKNTIVLAHFNALGNKDMMKDYAKAGITGFAMELMPRISRAQSMDVLSSQSNLAGYKAVIDASYHFTRAMPMMMTAAGTIAPAKVLVLGAGVAGLQAIATAKRLGAVVYAFDVRPAVKEQVESLGAKFVEVESEETKNAETKGGYAKEMSEDYKKKQSQAIADQLKKTDIAISTALIPGKKAPILITKEMLKDMRQGSVIVDLAAEAGGNCEATKPGKVAEVDGIKIIGTENITSEVSSDASTLFAKNILNFITPMIDKETKELKFNYEDELVKGTCIVKDGKVVHPMLAEQGGK